ncbi:MAG TPA: endonuclease [Bacteroidia bacterium]|nr:endonuclease [Bacteroidia bacterium]
MAKRTLLTCFLSVLLLSVYAQGTQLLFSNVQFGNVTTGKTDSAEVVLSSANGWPLNIKDINLFGTAFSFKGDTAFQLNGTSKSVWVYFSPKHNIQHAAQLIVVSEGWMNNRVNLVDYRISITGTGVYSDSYYSSTQNLSEEALKQALNTRLAQGYVTLGYTLARDKMFMEIDNWKVNGRGATTNTTQCIYTGRMVTGYASRTAAQNSPNNLNTEHTWPQSMFNSADPMVSDLHHLFVTDNTANSTRSNDPFAMVSSPTWSVGGSKSDGSSFEPRNEQKGSTARAMLYFVVRHGNQGNFLTAQQENVLRQWAIQYAPDSVDRKRNDDIFTYQKNRNPFVDHPEFLERITSLSSVSVPLSKRSVSINRNKFEFIRTGGTARMDTLVLELALTATGNSDIAVSNVKMLSGKFQVDTFPAIVQAGQSSYIRIKYSQEFFQLFLKDTLEFATNDPFKPLVQIPVMIEYYPESVKEQLKSQLALFPNPVSEKLNITLPGSEKISQILLVSPIGQQFTFVGNNEPMVVLSLPQMPAGCYFVGVATSNGGYFFSKIIIVQ